MKKTVPLAILQIIEPLLTQLDQAKLTVDRTSDSIFRVTDAEPGSDFFFEVTTASINSTGNNSVKMKYKPANAVDIGVLENHFGATQIPTLFSHWLKVIQGYQNVKSVYDDPILKKYAEDFYTEFESADEDATTVSFNLKQQLLLDSALTQVIHVLEAKKVEGDKELIAALIEQAEEIQATVTENTKQETLTKLSKFFAKIQKGGIKLIKDIYPIIQKEIIGAAIKNAAEHLPTILHSLSS
jgi:hypothetical protein